MEAADRTPPLQGFSRIFPGAAQPGHGEDAGDLLKLIIRALPADRIHTVAAACQALSYAIGETVDYLVYEYTDPRSAPDYGPPILEYQDALMVGHRPALRWYWTRRDRNGDLVIDLATQHTFRGETLSSIFAIGGHLECLELAYDLGCPLDADVCLIAATRGHLELLQWASSVGYLQEHIAEGDYETGVSYVDVVDIICVHAAEAGHVHILKWLRAQSPPCPWGSDVCEMAARNGHLAVLQWALAQTPPCPYRNMSYYAGKGAHIEVQQWLQENDYTQ